MQNFAQPARQRLVCGQLISNLTMVAEQIKKDIGHQPAPTGAAIGPDTPLSPPQEKDKVVNADKYFTPFRLACESRSPRIVRTALDCLQVHHPIHTSKNHTETYGLRSSNWGYARGG